MPNRRQLLSGLAALTYARPVWAQTKPTPPMPVVATFSILADFVRQVGGDRLVLTTLVEPGGDAHVYTPTPADARALVAARLVFINGLGFEGWVNRLIRSSGTKAAIIIATRGVTPLKAEKGSHDHGHAGHDQAESDPHAWQSVANARVYVANVLAALNATDPAGKDVFEANAKAYLTRLDGLEAEIRAAIARIPAGRRKIITSHDAFQYFEKAYGIDFISPRGISTSAEPSPQAVARIIRQIKAEKIPAVFLENISDQRLMKRIADETGARIGGTLYSDALTPAGGPAASYIEMMQHNVRQISGALAAS
jgi:zinc/manganese transport system substrate-binding protein